MSTDRIEKSIVLKAPRSRVWRALTNAQEFGTWFRVNLHGDFVLGQSVKGNITYPGYEHVVFDAHVERLEPEHAFAWRWHPHTVEPAKDYSEEERTLVEFTLQEVDEGTLLTVVESGFDRIPASRRELAFRGNSGGWEEQMQNIQRHVEG